MIIGIDFDNTIIRYDNLFFDLALEKKLIPKSLSKEKNEVRNYMRKQGIEDEWTIIQGEVYGSKIDRAKPFFGFFEAIKLLNQQTIPFYIISHKTKYPYMGDKIDLHESALHWMSINKFFDQDGLKMKHNQIFFEPTKEKKIERAIERGCTHFIDDLHEILNLMPSYINKIIFLPQNEKSYNGNNFQKLNSWDSLPSLLNLAH